MAKKVAVEDSLSDLVETLENHGYDITHMGDSDMEAIIVNGMDDNFMGMEDILYDVPVVNAEGKTPEEVLRELESKL